MYCMLSMLQEGIKYLRALHNGINSNIRELEYLEVMHVHNWLWTFRTSRDNKYQVGPVFQVQRSGGQVKADIFREDMAILDLG